MAETNKNKGNIPQGNPGNQGNQGGQGGQGNKGGAAGSTAEHTLSKATDTARDLASQAAQAASSAMSGMGEQVQGATAAVAGGMKNLAGTIRQGASGEGMMGSVGSTVADTLESSSQYLQQHGLGDMADDVTNLVRRNPIPAMLVCVGIGFCLGQLLSSSSRS